MDLAAIASGMRVRMPWDVGKLALELVGLPKGHGWDSTVAKLSELETKQGDLDTPQLLAMLREHTICGEKLTAMYKVSNSAKQNLRATLLKQEVPNGKFSKAYPGVLSDDALAEAAVGKLHLVALDESNEGLAAVFTSVRYIEAREKLLPEALPKAQADYFSEYNELVAVRHIRTQPMDVIWIPKNGNYVDIRVDHPKGLPEALGRAQIKRLKTHIEDLCEAKHLSNSVNYFPLIQKIYSTANEGRVVEIAFGTTTASLKHERMRRKKLCLRTEAYHKGGKNALNTPLEMYRLSVEWDVSFGGKQYSTPEVSFNGGARLAASSDPQMNEITIAKCLGKEDYEEIRAKIEAYLT